MVSWIETCRAVAKWTNIFTFTNIFNFEFPVWHLYQCPQPIWDLQGRGQVDEVHPRPIPPGDPLDLKDDDDGDDYDDDDDDVDDDGAGVSDVDPS